MCVYSFEVTKSDSLTQFGELFISGVFFKGEMLGGVPERRDLSTLICKYPFNGGAINYLWFEKCSPITDFIRKYDINSLLGTDLGAAIAIPAVGITTYNSLF
jgi:hypothetical protein